MADPFADLIPGAQQEPAQAGANPFADLIPDTGPALTLGVKPLAPNANLGDLLPTANVLAGQPAAPALDMSNLGTPAETARAAGEQFVGGGGQLLDKVHDFLQSSAGRENTGPVGAALADLIGDRGKQAEAFAGSPEQYHGIVPKVTGTLARGAPALAAALAAPEAEAPGITAEAAPTLAKIPGLLRVARTVAEQSPRAAALTALQESPNATPAETARDLAVNAAVFGAPGAGGNTLESRVLSGGGIGALVNEIVSRLDGQTPTPTSDLAMAVQGALGGAAHAGADHPTVAEAAHATVATEPKPQPSQEAPPAQSSAPPVGQDVAAVERALRKAGVPQATIDAAKTPARTEPVEAEASVQPASTGVPVMITQAMRAELRARGISDADIAKLTPKQAHDVLAQPVTAPATENAAAPNSPTAGTSSPERPIAQQWDALPPEERAVIAAQNGLSGRRAAQVATQAWAELDPGWQALFERRGLEPEAEPVPLPHTPEPAQPENADERGTVAIGPVRGVGATAPVDDHGAHQIEPAAAPVNTDFKRQFMPVRAQNGQVMTDSAGRPLRRPVLDLSRDTFAHWLAANGGVNFDEMKAQGGLDPAVLGSAANYPFGMHNLPAVRRKGGMSLEQLREKMQEGDWLPRDDPNAPATVGINDAVDAVMDQMNGHDVFHPYEGADERVQRQYAEHAADQAQTEEEFQREQAEANDIERQHAIEDLRHENARFATADHGEAFTFAQWARRAHDLGASADEIDHALLSGKTTAEKAANLSKLVAEKQHGVDTSAGGFGREGRTGADQEGQAAPAPEGESATGGEDESRTVAAARRGDLFAAPTAREQVAAAERAKDAQRNGQTGKVIPGFEGTDLGAGPAPEQADLASEPRELTDADLTPAEREAFQRQRNAQDDADLAQSMRTDSMRRGEQEAAQRGMPEAVQQALGDDARVRFVHDEDGLPENVQARLKPLAEGNIRKGAFDPRTGDVYLFTRHVKDAADAVWTAAHEIAGHKGFRALVSDRAGVKVGGRTPTEALAKAHDMALQNPTVAKLADVIGEQRGSADRRTMAEEALAELQAASVTGRWDEIARRYGVDVPKGVREGVQAAIRNFVARIKRVLNALYAKATGKPEPFTDEDVHAMLAQMREHAGMESRGEGVPLDSQERADDQTETPAFKRWFGNSKVVDAQGKPLVVYHGSKRPDRINKRFRKSRATSGPMAFFTESPEVSSSYATAKADTSLVPPEDYAGWFKYKPRGSAHEVDIDHAWYHLTPEQRATIADRLPRVNNTTPEGNESDTLRLGRPGEFGLTSGDHWQYEIRQAHGNVLKAAKELWLAGGVLFGDESKFMDVLRLGGMDMDRTRFDDPHAEYPAVFPVYLKIEHPLDTSNIPASVVDAVAARARRQRPADEYGADIWAKNTRDPVDWADELRRDVESEGAGHVWTSIPDFVTRTLRELGYDGIKDRGGKNGGVGHTVWVPFDDRQVKSATGNRGTFDPDSASILESAVPADAFDAGKPEEQPKPVELPARAPGESQEAWHARVMREGRGDMQDGMKAFNADTRTLGRGVIRATLADLHQRIAKAARAFDTAQAVFDKAGKDANLKAIDQWERGEEVTSAAHRLFFKAMQEQFDQRIEAIRQINPAAMKDLIANYFPHLWENPKKAGGVIAGIMQKRNLTGDKSFLKQRYWPTIKEGMASGLKPVSTNPVDLVLGKLAQMDKFIAMSRMMQDMDGRGWIKKIPAGEQNPEGYAFVDDPAFRSQHAVIVKGGEGEPDTARTLHWNYAVPEAVAKDINRYLSPGLYQFKGWRAFRGVQNFLLSARLGFSAFHAGFTTADTLVSHLDVAMRRASTGDVTGAAETLARTVASPILAPLEGRKLFKQFYGEAATDEHTAAVLNALKEGGARGLMNPTDENNSFKKVIRAARQGRLLKTALHALPATVEATTRLISHHLVPYQKMAARALLMKYELDRVAPQLGKDKGDYAGIVQAMNPDALRQIAGRVVQNVDDRLGQMAYDNLFWPRMVKDIAQATIQSVGWNVGTFNTIVGAAGDVKHIFKPERLAAPLDKAGTIRDARLSRVSGRLSYLISLNIAIAALSGTTQYLLTGQWPQELKDYFYPKTGRKNPDGTDERLSWPTYLKDEYALATHPVQTVEHKVHPVLSMALELWNNEDFYGTKIHNPDDPWSVQAAQIAKYLVGGFKPYAVQNQEHVAKAGGNAIDRALPFVGITPAPADVSRSPFESFLGEAAGKSSPSEARTPEQAAQTRAMHEAENAIRHGQEPDMRGLSPLQQRRVLRAAQQEVPQIRFKRLGIEDKLRAYALATPAEREQYGLAGLILRGRWQESIQNLPEQDRAPVMAQMRKVQEDYAARH